ncbi:MAG: type II toxin-antitoxin system HicA family toxin [bacterium]|nr:type II toxin-antitoxin system HicA family toxin [bacterium]
MNRLPSLTAAKIVRALKRAGFLEVEQKGSHLTFVNKLTGCGTTVPMHSGDVKRNLMKEIIQQAGLSENEFRKFL